MTRPISPYTRRKLLTEPRFAKARDAFQAAAELARVAGTNCQAALYGTDPEAALIQHAIGQAYNCKPRGAHWCSMHTLFDIVCTEQMEANK